MRLNKLFIATLLVFSTTMLQSCLKDQEDIFDEPASQRMQATLDNAKEVLMSAENGWLFDYTPDATHRYGSFIYTVKFDDANVTVGCELDPEQTFTSLYKLTNDNGPMLSFDSYNEFMHFFATPIATGGDYHGFEGDFEFIIMETTPDLVTLKGKRTGNIMYLRKLNEDPADVLNAVMAISDKLIVQLADGAIGETAVHADINGSTRYIEFSWGGDEPVAQSDDEAEETAVENAGEYFLPTATGIRFLAPVTVAGETINELAYDVNTFVFTGTSTSGTAISLQGDMDPSYSFIDAFEGNFTINHAGGSLDVTLTPISKDKVKISTGSFDLIAGYDKSIGALVLLSQVMCDEADLYVAMFAGNNAGSFYPNAIGAYGMMFVKDPENPSTFDAYSYGTSGIVSFMMIEVYGGKYYMAPEPYSFNGSYALSNIQSMTKL